MNSWHSKTLICLWLVASIGHLPLPWGHRHDNLAPEILAQHLQDAHSGSRTLDLPANWHWHLTVLGTQVPGEDRDGGNSSQSDTPTEYPYEVPLSQEEIAGNACDSHLEATHWHLAASQFVAPLGQETRLATAATTHCFSATYLTACDWRDALAVRLL